MIGGTGADAVTLATAFSGAINLNGGDGQPHALLRRRQYAHRLERRDDHRRQPGRHDHPGRRDHRRIIDLGGRDRHADPGQRHQQLTVSNTETITGGTGADTVTLGTTWSGTIDLAAGADTLILSSAGNNTLTVTNIETVTGGALDDAVTWATAIAAGTINLGAGTDTLTLSLGRQQHADRLERRNPDRRRPGRRDHLGRGAGHGAIDLGAGADTLTLAAAPTASRCRTSKPSPAAPAPIRSRSPPRSPARST